MGRVIRTVSNKQSIQMNYSNYQDEKSDNEMDSKYYNIGRFRKGYKHIVFFIVLELRPQAGKYQDGRGYNILSMRKRKLEERLVQVLRHDYGFYNAIFKWQGLPPPLDTSFDSLLPFLRRLEQKGIIRLFTIEGEQMIEVIRCP